MSETIQSSRRALVALSILTLACSSVQPSVAEPAADPDAPPVCTSCFEDGTDAQKAGDPALALRLFESGCAQDEGASCHAAAMMHVEASDAPESRERGFAFDVRACELEQWHACADVGAAMIWFHQRAPEGRAILKRACEASDADSCYWLAGASTTDLGAPVDMDEAVRLFDRSCELGNGKACAQFGLMLYTGNGVVSDPARAREVFERGCERGEPSGCSAFGVMARDGLGGPVDLARSVGAFQRGCDAGDPDACLNLGSAYARGEGGLESDADRAKELFEVACNGGIELGCQNRDEIAAAGEESAEEAEPK